MGCFASKKATAVKDEDDDPKKVGDTTKTATAPPTESGGKGGGEAPKLIDEIAGRVSGIREKAKTYLTDLQSQVIEIEQEKSSDKDAQDWKNNINGVVLQAFVPEPEAGATTFLEARGGERIEIVVREAGGWAWCRAESSGAVGWIPAAQVTELARVIADHDANGSEGLLSASKDDVVEVVNRHYSGWAFCREWTGPPLPGAAPPKEGWVTDAYLEDRRSAAMLASKWHRLVLQALEQVVRSAGELEEVLAQAKKEDWGEGLSSEWMGQCLEFTAWLSSELKSIIEALSRKEEEALTSGGMATVKWEIIPNSDIEMAVAVGDRVQVIDASNQDWIWCQLKDKEGWVPRNVLRMEKPMEAEDLPSWIKEGGPARWWSTSSSRYHEVTITSINMETREVRVTFNVDKSCWKSVSFDHFSQEQDAWLLHPVEDKAAELRAQLPTWIQESNGAWWWSCSQKRCHPVTIQEVSNRRRAVIFCFDSDNTVRKQVPFHKLIDDPDACYLQKAEANHAWRERAASKNKRKKSKGKSKPAIEGLPGGENDEDTLDIVDDDDDEADAESDADARVPSEGSLTEVPPDIDDDDDEPEEGEAESMERRYSKNASRKLANIFDGMNQDLGDMLGTGGLPAGVSIGADGSADEGAAGKAGGGAGGSLVADPVDSMLQDLNALPMGQSVSEGTPKPDFSAARSRVDSGPGTPDGEASRAPSKGKLQPGDPTEEMGQMGSTFDVDKFAANLTQTPGHARSDLKQKGDALLEEDEVGKPVLSASANPEDEPAPVPPMVGQEGGMTEQELSRERLPTTSTVGELRPLPANPPGRGGGGGGVAGAGAGREDGGLPSLEYSNSEQGLMDDILRDDGSSFGPSPAGGGGGNGLFTTMEKQLMEEMGIPPTPSVNVAPSQLSFGNMSAEDTAHQGSQAGLKSFATEKSSDFRQEATRLPSSNREEASSSGVGLRGAAAAYTEMDSVRVQPAFGETSEEQLQLDASRSKTSTVVVEEDLGPGTGMGTGGMGMAGGASGVSGGRGPPRGPPPTRVGVGGAWGGGSGENDSFSMEDEASRPPKPRVVAGAWGDEPAGDGPPPKPKKMGWGDPQDDSAASVPAFQSASSNRGSQQQPEGEMAEEMREAAKALGAEDTCSSLLMQAMRVVLPDTWDSEGEGRFLAPPDVHRLDKDWNKLEQELDSASSSKLSKVEGGLAEELQALEAKIDAKLQELGVQLEGRAKAADSKLDIATAKKFRSLQWSAMNAAERVKEDYAACQKHRTAFRKNKVSVQKKALRNALLRPAGALTSAFVPDPEAIRKLAVRDALKEAADAMGDLFRAVEVSAVRPLPVSDGPQTIWSAGESTDVALEEACEGARRRVVECLDALTVRLRSELEELPEPDPTFDGLQWDGLSREELRDKKMFEGKQDFDWDRSLEALIETQAQRRLAAFRDKLQRVERILRRRWRRGRERDKSLSMQALASFSSAIADMEKTIRAAYKEANDKAEADVARVSEERRALQDQTQLMFSVALVVREEKDVMNKAWYAEKKERQKVMLQSLRRIRRLNEDMKNLNIMSELKQKHSVLLYSLRMLEAKLKGECTATANDIEPGPLELNSKQKKQLKAADDAFEEQLAQDVSQLRGAHAAQAERMVARIASDFKAQATVQHQPSLEAALAGIARSQQAASRADFAVMALKPFVEAVSSLGVEALRHDEVNKSPLDAPSFLPKYKRLSEALAVSLKAVGQLQRSLSLKFELPSGVSHEKEWEAALASTKKRWQEFCQKHPENTQGDETPRSEAEELQGRRMIEEKSRHHGEEGTGTPRGKNRVSPKKSRGQGKAKAKAAAVTNTSSRPERPTSAVPGQRPPSAGGIRPLDSNVHNESPKKAAPEVEKQNMRSVQGAAALLAQLDEISANMDSAMNHTGLNRTRRSGAGTNPAGSSPPKALAPMPSRQGTNGFLGGPPNRPSRGG